MRSRALLSVMASLVFGLAACSSKPASDAAANNADQTSSSSGGSMADSRRSPVVKAPTVVPAGTTLTVRIGEALDRR